MMGPANQKRRLSSFLSTESGVVTTDFVFITAAIVGLGLAVGSSVGVGGVGLAEDTVAAVESQSSDASAASSSTAKTKKEERAEKRAERKKKREARKKRRAERKAKKQAKKNR